MSAEGTADRPGEGTAWVDGELVTQPAVPVFGRGLAAGRGLFETMGAVEGRLPLWERHFARLSAGAVRLGIRCAPPRDLRPAAEELLRRAGRPDGVLRLVLTAGAERPSFSMTTRERVHARVPIRLFTGGPTRHPDDPPAAVKSTFRRFYELAMADARAAGADDGLILSTDGEVLETTTANVFCRLDGELCTPRANGAFLAGVARAVLLDGLRAAGTPAQERVLRLADLRAAAGIWVTNAVYGPRPAALAGESDPGSGSAGVEGSDSDPLDGAWQRAVGTARSDELP